MSLAAHERLPAPVAAERFRMCFADVGVPIVVRETVCATCGERSVAFGPVPMDEPMTTWLRRALVTIWPARDTEDLERTKPRYRNDGQCLCGDLYAA